MRPSQCMAARSRRRNKGFASDTGSSHRWLAGLLDRSVGSLPSAGVTRLQRYYEPVRPCASHRDSAPQGSAPWRSPLASRRQVPTFRTRASRWSHAVFMPVAARPVGRLPPSFVAGQQREPGFGDVPTLSTRQQRFTHVRLTSAHLTGLIPPFPATLTTSAIGPTQLAVVWTLILQSEPEGPTLISCAARLPGVARYISHLLAPSWRTVIRVTDDDHVARGLAPSPALGPEIERVVQVDVGQERRDHRPLPGPRLTDAHDPILQDPRPQPFLDQTEDARIADPMVQEAEQPFLVNRVEERPDVGVQDPAHLGAGDPNRDRVQRIVRAPSGPEPVRETEEVLLVDGAQHLDHRALDDFVFYRRDGQRAPAAVRLGDEPAAGGQRPVRSPVDPLVQALDQAIEVCFVGLPRQPVHAGGGLPPEGEEGRPEPVGGDMVEERGEPFLLSLSCNVPYAVQPL